MNKIFWKAALIRAIKTVAQSLVSNIPVGIVITPVMIQEADWSIVYIILGWLATGIIAGVTSILTSLAGLPEVKMQKEKKDGKKDN